MLMTGTQFEALTQNTRNWDNLLEHEKQRVEERFKGQILEEIQEIPVADLENIVSISDDIKNAIERSWEIAENNRTPWFFLEIFLEQKGSDGKTMNEVVDEMVQERAKRTLYYDPTKHGLEPIH